MLDKAYCFVLARLLAPPADGLYGSHGSFARYAPRPASKIGPSNYDAPRSEQMVAAKAVFVLAAVPCGALKTILVVRSTDRA
jgi:hypothetical protein